jgi:NADH-quinone oxidoreductase subunit M
MFAHGLSAAGLFYLIDLVEQRTGTRSLDSLGGLRKSVPVLCGVMGIILFASLGLPGLAGFVGEFMIFQGAFPLAPRETAIAVFGILLTAVYLLGMLGKIFFGPPNEKWNTLTDLTLREKLVAGALITLLLTVGLAPQPLINLSNSTITQMAKAFQ